MGAVKVIISRQVHFVELGDGKVAQQLAALRRLMDEDRIQEQLQAVQCEHEEALRRLRQDHEQQLHDAVDASEELEAMLDTARYEHAAMEERLAAALQRHGRLAGQLRAQIASLRDELALATAGAEGGNGGSLECTDPPAPHTAGAYDGALDIKTLTGKTIAFEVKASGTSDGTADIQALTGKTITPDVKASDASDGAICTQTLTGKTITSDVKASGASDGAIDTQTLTGKTITPDVKASDASDGALDEDAKTLRKSRAHASSDDWEEHLAKARMKVEKASAEMHCLKCDVRFHRRSDFDAHIWHCS